MEQKGYCAAPAKGARYKFHLTFIFVYATLSHLIDPLPFLEGNPRSCWIPRSDLDASTCTSTLEELSTTVLANALWNSNDINPYLRDVHLWNDVAEDGCDAADSLEYGMPIMMESESCWENVHRDHMWVYFNFLVWVNIAPFSF